MAEGIDYDKFQAEQRYFDLSEAIDLNQSDSFFDYGVNAVHELDLEDEELSCPESDTPFFTPDGAQGQEVQAGSSYVRQQPNRRSLSLGDLLAPTVLYGTHDHERPPSVNDVSHYHQPRIDRRTISKEAINRLAQPKQYASNENLTKNKFVSLAEQLDRFEKKTPQRFRAKPLPQQHVHPNPASRRCTRGQSPKLETKKRSRPNSPSVMSREQREEMEAAEAQAMKFKARPIPRNFLKEPMLPVVDKKETTAPKTPNVLKRSKKPVAQEAGTKIEPNKPLKATRCIPQPFSFDAKDKMRLKKKEENIQKFLEEERKAREFHANPVPKRILRSRENLSSNRSDSSSRSRRKSSEDLYIPEFRAKPPTVLKNKPFIPQKDENHVLEVVEFRFATDERSEARTKFLEQLKEKEDNREARKREMQELEKKMEEAQIAELRRQAAFKAQPIKKYKEVKVVPSNKVTTPISPKLLSQRNGNKENTGEQ